MDHFWLAHYPPGISDEINLNQFESLVSLYEDSFARFHDRKAYICMDRAITYRDIDVMSRNLGAWLQGRGLKTGDRVAIMMPNVLQYPVAVAAIARAGFILVNVNPLYTPRELKHQLKDSGAKAIIVLENFANTLEQSIAETDIEHVIIASMGDLLGFAKGAIVNFVVRRKMVPAYSLPGATPFNKALAAGADMSFTRSQFKHSDIVALQYTGGTTGVSKGAILTHGALLAAVMSTEAWLQPALKKRKNDDPLISVCALPLYHIYAFVSCSLAAMRTGDICLLIPNPRDIPGLVKELAKYKLNLFPGVNTLFNALVHNPDFAKLDFSHLLGATGGGTAVQEVVAKKWRALTGLTIVEGYGLSETCSAISCNKADTEVFTGTAGLPMPGAEIKILDDNGVEVPHGAPGEIVIRGPQLMAGYWNMPEETAKVMTADGFFKSGDIGTMDDNGYIRIVDRKKDMILVSGFNVYPNEIEAVMAEFPGVLECAVVGVPDDNSGEAVMLYVVPKDHPLDKDAMRAFSKTQLTGYKTPRYIEFRTQLPKTNVGKILRRELRDEALHNMGKTASPAPGSPDS